MAALSKISAIRVKLCTAAIVRREGGEGVPFDKLRSLLGDTKLDVKETKAVVAALTFIVTSSARSHSTLLSLPHLPSYRSPFSPPLSLPSPLPLISPPERTPPEIPLPPQLPASHSPFPTCLPRLSSPPSPPILQA